jgi:uracil-DNA glycosylase
MSSLGKRRRARRLKELRRGIQAALKPIRRVLKREMEKRKIAKAPICFRPFVCKGDPYKCQVMFVGFNSANSMAKDWGKYWSDRSGFLYEKWRADYDLLHEEAAASRTRKVMELIIEQADRPQYLTTNLYSIPTRRKAGLPTRYQTMEMESVFRYLLHELSEKVRVIVPLGIDAVRWFEALCDDCKIRDKVLWPFENDQEREFCHFGYGFSDDRALKMGISLRRKLRPETP